MNKSLPPQRITKAARATAVSSNTLEGNGWDWEEEARLERRECLHRNRAIGKEACEQAKRVSAFRAAYSSQASIPDKAFPDHEGPSWRMTPKLGFLPRDVPWPDHAPSTSSCSDFAAWRLHEDRWQRVDDQKLDNLGKDDIPWPPDEAKLLQATVRLALEASHLQGGLDRVQDRTNGDAVHGRCDDMLHKQAFRNLSLRWHPDKFQGRYGSRLIRKDQAVIMQRVCTIFQCVSNQWQSYVGAERL